MAMYPQQQRNESRKEKRESKEKIDDTTNSGEQRASGNNQSIDW